jgi:diguanylate cyclase (GGDEF)-like protein
VKYKTTVLGEFRDKDIENVFLVSEIGRGLTLARLLILFSSLAFVLIGIADLLLRKDVNPALLKESFLARIVIFLLGFCLFFAIRRFKSYSAVRVSVYIFASLVYLVYFYLAFKFAPLDIISPTFAVILLSTCLFLMPTRWITNLCFTLLYSAFFIAVIPVLCAATAHGLRVIAVSYLVWNLIIVSTLFYSINLYKRNYYAKALQLEELANTDQLTKLHNRKAFDDMLDSTCRDSAAFSVIMFDIDNFKHINDTYGHVAGDDVIINITQYARKTIRKNDVLARWGGEEFMIVMPDATLNEASELAKRLKEQLSALEHDCVREIITCSFGVTSFVAGESAKAVVRRADQLLYLAKEYGKNRVVAG